jgi:predicted nucleic acid-binding protein
MRLFLDACTLIYRFEGAAKFRDATTALIAELAAGHAVVELAVSRLSVLECRVKPLREGNTALLQRYADFFAAVAVIELDAAVVDVATDVRARFGLKTPDALQAACALTWQAGGDEVLFLTADAGFDALAGLQVRRIMLPA